MAQAVPAAALTPPRHWSSAADLKFLHGVPRVRPRYFKSKAAAGGFRKAMSWFVASARRPEISSILLCAADFCLMSKLALPCKRDAGEKRIGAVGAPGEAR
jgi:hypothetical protein